MAAFTVMEEGLYHNETIVGVVRIRFLGKTQKDLYHYELAGRMFQDTRMPRIQPIVKIP